MTQFRLLFIIALALSGILTLESCGKLSSVFYSQDNPEALQRDTITASGSTTSTVIPVEYKGNGIIRLVPIEVMSGRDSVLISVPEAAKTTISTFEVPRKLYMPSGFTAEVVAWGLGQARDIVVRNDGTLFVSSNGGRIYAISPDGSKKELVSGLKNPHGLDLVGNQLFYTDETHVYRFDLSGPNSTEGTTTMLTDRIPSGGTYYSRTIKYRPDDKTLYVSVGGQNPNGIEDREHGTLFRVSPEGGTPTRFFISGLRNTVGFDLNPETGEFWGIDQGMDNVAEHLAPDELNILQSGKVFGHPYFYANNIPNPAYKESVRPKNATAPIALLEPNAQATDLEFYTGTALGNDWKNSMIVVYNGVESGNVVRPKRLRTGFKLARLKSNASGSDARESEFISGWLNGEGDFWGRPVAVAISEDGRTFYVTDEKNGVVYRFTKG